jgi:hypothetical protein
MTATWLRVSLLLVLSIALHDLWMAMDGHRMLHPDPAPACAERAASTHHHGGHHHGEHHAAPDESGPSPAEIASTCREMRVAVPMPRLEMELDQGPTTDLPLPETGFALLFAFTSPVVVNHPPAHPPDVQRALFQVYLI